MRTKSDDRDPAKYDARVEAEIAAIRSKIDERDQARVEADRVGLRNERAAEIAALRKKVARRTSLKLSATRSTSVAQVQSTPLSRTRLTEQDPTLTSSLFAASLSPSGLCDEFVALRSKVVARLARLEAEIFTLRTALRNPVSSSDQPTVIPASPPCCQSQGQSPQAQSPPLVRHASSLPEPRDRTRNLIVPGKNASHRGLVNPELSYESKRRAKALDSAPEDGSATSKRPRQSTTSS
ncbi:hypothetical protein BCR34DRAFT_619317 [Clohesyomyces aquaticus]|uniref:Uncharacterized protein n=1 Tax=Clohesyomyces aquaticus TaxID=1231657 RepID=A0A1Y1YIB9_9PLEO|nr:hypothetical protein BCR34DRAFT_619317 [Clohesyomyces aquaticus]